MQPSLPVIPNDLAVQLELAFQRYCDAFLHSQPGINSHTLDTACSVAVNLCRMTMVDRAKRLNSSVGVNRIPQEILVMVFECLPITARWTAATVCDRWRAIMLANSSLWAEIVCEVDKNGLKPCLSTALRRAGDRQMTISIRFGVDTTSLQLSQFCDTLPSWANRVVLLKIAIQLYRGSSTDSRTGDTDEIRNDMLASLTRATGVTDHIAQHLSQSLSSASFPQLEALVLLNIPLRFHQSRLASLRRLTCPAGVFLEADAMLEQLVVFRANQLTSRRKEALEAAFAHPMSLQQLHLAQCMPILAALQHGRDPQPLANLRYLQWPALWLLDPVVSKDLILACSDRRWTHLVPWDWNIQMRLVYVAERLPSDSIVELHYNRGPNSAYSSLRMITASAAQWLFPRSLSDEVSATLMSHSVGNALTSLTVFSYMRCSKNLSMPQLKTLGILIAARKDAVPIIIVHGQGKLWHLPKLEALRLEREADGDRGRVQVFGRSAGDAHVPFKAWWADRTVTMDSAEVARFVREKIRHGGHLATLILRGVSLQNSAHIPSPINTVIEEDMAAEVEFKVPYMFADDHEATNMYATINRPVQ